MFENSNGKIVLKNNSFKYPWRPAKYTNGCGNIAEFCFAQNVVAKDTFFDEDSMQSDYPDNP